MVFGLLWSGPVFCSSRTKVDQSWSLSTPSGTQRPDQTGPLNTMNMERAECQREHSARWERWRTTGGLLLFVEYNWNCGCDCDCNCGQRMRMNLMRMKTMLMQHCCCTWGFEHCCWRLQHKAHGSQPCMRKKPKSRS